LPEKRGRDCQEERRDPPGSDPQTGGSCDDSQEVFERGFLESSCCGVPSVDQDQSNDSEQKSEHKDGRRHRNIVPNGSVRLFHGFPLPN
jgi:hypothetical protein